MREGGGVGGVGRSYVRSSCFRTALFDEDHEPKSVVLGVITECTTYFTYSYVTSFTLLFPAALEGKGIHMFSEEVECRSTMQRVTWTVSFFSTVPSKGQIRTCDNHPRSVNFFFFSASFRFSLLLRTGGWRDSNSSTSSSPNSKATETPPLCVEILAAAVAARRHRPCSREVLPDPYKASCKNSIPSSRGGAAQAGPREC